MEFEVGERVAVKNHGSGEVIGHLGGACVTVKLDSGSTMHVHVTGVEKESASDLRSAKE